MCQSSNKYRIKSPFRRKREKEKGRTGRERKKKKRKSSEESCKGRTEAKATRNAEKERKKNEKTKRKAATGGQKRKQCEGSSSVLQSNPKSKRRKLDIKDRSLQHQEISMNECAVCCGLYEEDIDEESGVVTSDWIQCTNVECAVWSHVNCLQQSIQNVLYAI